MSSSWVEIDPVYGVEKLIEEARLVVFLYSDLTWQVRVRNERNRIPDKFLSDRETRTVASKIAVGQLRLIQDEPGSVVFRVVK